MARSGWYNDESDPALARWHDGVAWTDHVLDKAEWEAAGVEPPPPAERHGDWPAAGGPDRRRAVAAAAFAVVALAVGGVALAIDGSDDAPEPAPTVESSVLAERVDGVAGLDVDAPALDTSIVGPDPSTAARPSTAVSSTTRSSSRAPSTTAGGVRRTETSSRTRTNADPISTPGADVSGDKDSVGNKSSTTIVSGYVPPPPTTTTVPPPTTTPPDTIPATDPTIAAS